MFSKKNIIKVLSLFLVFTISIGSVAAGATHGDSNNNWGNIVIHTCGWGDVGNPNHDSVNGIPFDDDAWLLAYVFVYRIVAYDANDQVLLSTYTDNDDDDESMGSATSDDKFYVPNNTSYIKFYADCGGTDINTDTNFISTVYLPDDWADDLAHVKYRIVGAIKADGLASSGREYHHKIGYVKSSLVTKYYNGTKYEGWVDSPWAMMVNGDSGYRSIKY